MFVRMFGFPVWWYSHGLIGFVKWASGTVTQLQRSLALRIWVQNLFVPMYGDASFTGRAISFFIRLIMIIIRSIGVGLYMLLLFIVFLTYLLLPPFVLFGFIFHAQSFI